MMTAEQIAAAHKANMETFFGLTQKAFEGVEKIVELNMAATKATLEEVAENAEAALSAKDAQEFLALQANMMKPLAEKTAAYSRQMYEISADSATELGKVLEAQTTEAQKKMKTLVEDMGKNAPAGSEAGVAMVKNMVASANTAFESMQKAAKQASDMAQQNFNTMTKAATTAPKANSRSRSAS